MENLVPLLIVAAVVYRIYSEYRKEQEKARGRVIRKPAVPVPQNVPPSPFPEFDLPEPWHSVPARKEPQASEIVRQETKKAAPKKKEYKKEDLVSLRDEKPAFDLRAAVIQSAILERRF